MDITNLYRNLVTINLGQPAPPPKPSACQPDELQVVVDQIQQQLLQITQTIRSIKPRYLSLSKSNKMLDNEKDDFDKLTRQLIEREKFKVDLLERKENERFEQFQKRSLKSVFFNNEKEQKLNETIHHHRIGMLRFLNQKLQLAFTLLREMNSVRYQRTLVKTNPITELKESQTQEAILPEKLEVDLEISNDDMVVIQMEHDELVDQLNTTLLEAEKVEKSLIEISQLQCELSQHLQSQTLQLETLSMNALKTSKEIGMANDYLESAKRGNRFASRCVIFASLGVGVMLLLANGR